MSETVRANTGLETAAAPADDELARLERMLAEQATGFNCGYWHRKGWATVFRDDKDAARYLELRGLLERHPHNPELVRVKEQTNEPE